MTLAALMTAVGACWFLVTWSKERVPEHDSSMNEIRLAANPLLLFLEQNNGIIEDADIQQTLREMADNQGLGLVYAGLDGAILFSTYDYDRGDRIDLRHSLHYDWHEARREGGRYRIAFPILDDTTGTLVASAIFDVPERMVAGEPSTIGLAPLALLCLSLLLSVLLIVLLLAMRGNFKSRVIAPVNTLKERAENMLRGNYEPGAEYARKDELGDLNAIFDQIRLELAEQRSRRTKQDKAQKELITNISHEIRTPITTVKAYMEAILEGVCTDQETMMEYVGIMRNHTDNMSRQVEDLFIHAMQELGQISVEPKERYSKDAFPPMLESVGHYVRTQGISYVETLDMPNVLLPIDAVRIEQVITNLVTNALKHTAPGDIITVSAELEDDSLKFTVADTGRGIRPQDMPFLFERYYRGGSAAADPVLANEGNGLGLSICKHIVEAHGGTISLKSREGSGTEFFFTLPLC